MKNDVNGSRDVPKSLPLQAITRFLSGSAKKKDGTSFAVIIIFYATMEDGSIMVLCVDERKKSEESLQDRSRLQASKQKPVFETPLELAAHVLEHEAGIRLISPEKAIPLGSVAVENSGGKGVHTKFGYAIASDACNMATFLMNQKEHKQSAPFYLPLDRLAVLVGLQQYHKSIWLEKFLAWRKTLPETREKNPKKQKSIFEIFGFVRKIVAFF